MTQRIAVAQDPDEETRAILESTKMGNERGEALNIFRTLAQHPRLLRRFNILAGAFMTKGLLQPRIRELVVLRVAWSTRAEYEWGQHVIVARRCGISEPEITSTTLPLIEGQWTIKELAALEVTDELIADCNVDDRAWANAANHFDEPELLELILLVGFYRMAAGFLNAALIDREPWLEAWPEGMK